jgi:uncharacterized protein (TIGR00297 family)
MSARRTSAGTREAAASPCTAGWRGRALPAGEARRKLVHAGMGLFALALPFLAWWQAGACALAAFLFNWLLMPRLLGHRMATARAGSSDRGVLLYPLVVLGLILLFRSDLSLAAFGWGVLAFGDAAAGVVGQKWGRHALPWNPGKSWEGLAAFWAAGLLAGSLLAAWTSLPYVAAGVGGYPFTPSRLHELPFFRQSFRFLPDFLLVGALPVALAALLEGLPHGLDDNVIVPFVAASSLFVGDFPAAAGSAIPVGFAWILLVNTGCAALAWAAGALRPGGIAAAWVLGVVTAMSFGVRGFGLLLAFLLAGLLVTFAGYRRKRSTGVAEGHGGRRGVGEVLGKGGVLLAVGLQVLWMDAWHRGLFAAGWSITAILAAALADTWGTEIGGLLGRRAFTLWPLRAAPPGTSGAVSLPGLLASLLGAALIAGLGVWLGLLGETPLRLAAICTAAAVLAAVIESLLPRLGVATHVGKNLVVTVLPPLFVAAALGFGR